MALLSLVLITTGAAFSVELAIKLDDTEVPKEGSSTPATVQLMPVDRPGASIDVDMTPSRSRTVTLPHGGKWRGRVVGAGIWAPSQVLDLAAETHDMTFSVTAGGRIGGKVEVPRGSELPTSLTVRIDCEDAKGRKFPAEETCAIDLDGGFDCPVPARKVDLRLSAEAFIAHYRWDLTVGQNETSELGRVDLVPGASVVGWIGSDTAEASLELATVKLSPLLAGKGMGMDIPRKHPAVTLESPVQKRGFFQLAGVPAGSYSLVVEHPQLSSQRIAPIWVEDGDQVELDPISLEPKAQLHLQVVPATDPYRQPWQLRLAPLDARVTGPPSTQRATLPEAGAWSSPPLDRGKYQLLLTDSRGSRWQAERLDLTYGDTFHEARIPLTRFEIRFTLDDEPVVQGEVVLSQPAVGATVRRRTDDDGTIYTFLPKDHQWDVQISQREDGIFAHFDGVEVPETARGDRWPKRELQVPATTLRGRVVDAEGLPAPSSTEVRIQHGAASFTAPIDAKGHFIIRGIGPGQARLQAHLDGDGGIALQSNVEIVEALEHGEMGDVELVLARELLLSGAVLASGGAGIPGAQVVATLESPGGTSPSLYLRQTVTDVDGVFEIDLPEGLAAVQLAVFPPGFAAMQQRIQLPNSDPVILVPDREAGQVTISFDQAPGDWSEQRLKWGTHLFHDELLVGTTHVLSPWAHLHGVESREERMLVPMLAPGRYAACFELPVPAAQFRNLSDQLRSHCASGFLVAGGTLRLEIPEGAFASSSQERTRQDTAQASRN